MTYIKINILSNENCQRIMNLVNNIYFQPKLVKEIPPNELCIVDKQIVTKEIKKRYPLVIEYKETEIDQIQQEIFLFHVKALQQTYKNTKVKPLTCFLVPFLYNPGDKIYKDELILWLCGILGVNENYRKNMESHIIPYLKRKDVIFEKTQGELFFAGITEVFVQELSKYNIEIPPDRVKITKKRIDKQYVNIDKNWLNTWLLDTQIDKNFLKLIQTLSPQQIKILKEFIATMDT